MLFTSINIYNPESTFLHQTRHYVDIHIYSHVYDLTNLIRNVAVVLYFQPFQTIRLDRMSAAFGWTVDEVEKEVVALIQSGQIQGRVDSQNKASETCWYSYMEEITHTIHATDPKSQESRSQGRIVRARHKDRC
jgi:COP9 signalosome complex subunit 1